MLVAVEMASTSVNTNLLLVSIEAARVLRALPDFKENCETYVRMQEVQLRNAKRCYTCAKHVMPSASFGPWSLLVRIFETSQRFAPPESPESDGWIADKKSLG